MEFILIGIGVVIIFVIFKFIADSKAQKNQVEMWKERYPNSDVHVSLEDNSFCVLDYDANAVVLGLKLQRGGLLTPELPYEQTAPFSAIRKVEIKSNGTTIASTNRGSQAIGAAVGALAFGGVGAIIGGLSGSTTSTERVRNITLAITIDDRERPVHNITFLNWAYDKKGLKSDHHMVRAASSAIESFAARVENAMNKPSEGIRPAPALEESGKDTVELVRELWKLREAGALTQEEFQAEKERILRQVSGIGTV
jgi:hypothetical protein